MAITWTPDEDRRMFAMLAEGKSKGAIARELDRPRSSIDSRLTTLSKASTPQPPAPKAKPVVAPPAGSRSKCATACAAPPRSSLKALTTASAANAARSKPIPTIPERSPMTSETIPAGYLKNQAGHLVPVSTVKPIDLERDKLVAEIIAKARALNGEIVQFKAAVFGDIAAFVELSAEQYGAKVGGQKGNVTLMSFDGRYKVQRAIAEHISFDERLQAAKALIDECITDWSRGARAEIQVLVNDAFQVDKEGNINTGRVLGLRRLQIDDARWQKAMQAISEAVQVVGSKSYIRVYERDEASGEYRAIPLDVAAA